MHARPVLGAARGDGLLQRIRIFVCVTVAIAFGTVNPAGAQYRDVQPPPPCRPARGEAGVAPSGSPSEIRQLAIIPFETGQLTRDARVLADAFSDRLAFRLKGLRPRDVRINGVAGSVTPKSENDAKVLAKILNVRYLAVGSVEPSERGMRVRVRLLNGKDGSEIWDLREERRSGDFLELDYDVPLAITRRAFRGLNLREVAALSDRPTRNAEAYRHFLRGTYYFGRREPGAAAAAIKQYDAATLLDPDFALAWARFAMSYALWLHGETEAPLGPDSLLLEHALSVAGRALTASPRSAEGWVARGALLELRSPRALAGALEAYARAISLNARGVDAYLRSGRALMHLGRPAEAELRLRQGLAIDAEQWHTLAALAELNWQERRYGDACRYLNAAISAETRAAYPYALRALTRLRLSEYRDAYSDAETAARLGEGLLGEAAAVAVAVASDESAGARSRARRLLRYPRATRGRLAAREGHFLAIALAAVGEERQALAVMERVYPHGVVLWWTLKDLYFDALRSEARFRRLLADTSPAVTDAP
ncbi:MAG: hypothetical protein ACR2G6_10805 [Gemmatimonadaceae bacterium]